MRTLVASACLCFSLCTSAHAGLILSPVGVTTDMGNRFSGAIGNTINQSGLNSIFSSGVTDFDVYNPAAVSTVNTSGVQWWGAADRLGVTDFDLGATYDVSRLAYWGRNLIFGMRQFRVLIDDTAAFSSATDLGTFNANVNNFTGQVFDLTDGTGRYVRFEHLSYFSNSSNMSEVAFEVSSPAAVPEPGSFAIIGIGALGLAFRRRSRAIAG